MDLKAAAVKKMRLRLTGYFQGEYMYMLGKEGIIMNYKEYGVNKQKAIMQGKMVIKYHRRKQRTVYSKSKLRVKSHLRKRQKGRGNLIAQGFARGLKRFFG